MWVKTILAISTLVMAFQPDESRDPPEGYLPSAVGVLDEASIHAALSIYPDNQDLCLRVFLFKNLTASEWLKLMQAGINPSNLSSEQVLSHRSAAIGRFLVSQLKIRDTDVISDRQMMEARDGRFPALVVYCPKSRVREVVQSMAKAQPEIELVDAYAPFVTMQEAGKSGLKKETQHFFPSYWRVRSNQDSTTVEKKLAEAEWKIVDREFDGTVTALVATEIAHRQLKKDDYETLELVQSNLTLEGFPGAKTYRIWIPGKSMSEALRELPPDVQLVAEESDRFQLTIWANLRQKELIEDSGKVLFPVAINGVSSHESPSEEPRTAPINPVPNKNPRPSSDSASIPTDAPLLSVGKWLRGDSTYKIQIEEKSGHSFGGWQTSDLTFDRRTKTWWSIGDQNCRESGPSPHRGRYAFKIELSGNEPTATPVPIWWKDEKQFVVVDESFRDGNPGLIDFEGIAADPVQSNHFFACTEGRTPWLIEMVLVPNKWQMNVIRSVQLSIEGNHDIDRNEQPASIDADKSWEGVALSSDGQKIYLCTEWNQSPSQLYELSTVNFRNKTWSSSPAGRLIAPQIIPNPVPMPHVPSELCGITVSNASGQDELLLLDRNQSRIGRWILGGEQPIAWIPVELRAPALDERPEGVRIKSASPEGIAVDDLGQVVLISDPWAKLYQAEESGASTEMLSKLVPLVFQLRMP